jgi:hypothetical protein
MVGEASGRMQKADCRDEIALPAAMLAWLKYRKQRTRNSRKRFLVFFCCGAMSPVEGSKSPRQINHPLCGCASKVKPIDSHFATMRVFKPQSRKESLWLTKVIALHIRNGCANTI